jgi:hypothetical protein
MDLPAGAMGRITCLSSDAAGTVLHRGVVYRVLPTADDTLAIDLADAADTTPPVVGGSLTATVLGATEVELSWPMATDGGQPDPAAAYLVWAQPATAPGTKDLNAPTMSVPAGQTSVVVGGLLAGERHEFALAAVDPAGNVSHQTAVAGANLMATSACVWVDVGTGSDAPGRGTYDQPYKTITYALDQSAGEPVYVAAGTYSAATGETFPLVLKDGTNLAGDIHWPTGRPQVTLEVGTTEAAIQVPVSGSVSGFVIENPGGGMNFGIDARDGDVRVDHVRIDGLNGSGGVILGAEGIVRHCTIRGFYAGRGIVGYGSGHKTVWSCLVEDCSTGIALGGSDGFIHLCLVRDCINGISVAGEDVGSGVAIQVSRSIVRGCSDGFSVQDARDTLLLGNLVWQCTQMGIHLSDVDSSVRIDGCHVDACPTGIYVRRGDPVITHSTLVCNRVNLFAGGTGQVDATHCRWDNDPPTVYELEDEYDICPDGDVCYDGNYSGTPVPLLSPVTGTTGCLNLGVVPNVPKALPGFLEKVTPRTYGGES